MSKLNYITRGNADPNGKPRVWFCAHPQDNSQYLNEIAEQILKHVNASVWYDENPEDEYNADELFVNLSQMQLFVMPVTSGFLMTENRALDVEFKFALDNHIPILPLMQEEGLTGLFSKKCGDLQFLSRLQNDYTAIPYDEKLRNFLNSVLINDEDIVRIRKAFKGYIFLSYRKKDRKYAKELMSIIHNAPACLDVAIWYDEFLIPGENFNDTIAKSIAKSDIFVMAITPNVSCEENYISTTEYPMAREMGKNILPLEIVSTDRDELASRFKDLPVCVDVLNSDELLKALEKGLPIIVSDAPKGKDGFSAEHSFFIGLAYLGGVDVERNSELAVSLITKAAELGFEVAIARLVSIYKNGDGVERDYYSAIEWQKKLVQRKKEKFISSYDENDESEYLRELFLLGELYWELSFKDDAKKCYEQMLEHCGKWKDGCNNKKASLFSNLINAYIAMAVICAGEGCYEDAKQYADKIIAFLEPFSVIYEFAINLAVAHAILGDIALSNERYGEAELFYNRAIDMFSLARGDDVQKALDMSTLYSRLGEIKQKTLDLDEAERFYLKAIEIRGQQMELEKSAETQYYLAVAYRRLGEIRSLKKDYSGAEKYLLDALKILEPMCYEVQILKYFDQLSNLECIIAHNFMDKGDLKSALEYAYSAFDISKQLYESPLAEKDGVDYSFALELAKRIDTLARIYESMNNISSYANCVKNSLEIRLRDKKHNSDASLTLEIALNRIDVANAYILTGDFDNVEMFIFVSVGEILKLTEPYPSIEHIDALWRAYDIYRFYLNELGKDFTPENADEQSAARLWKIMDNLGFISKTAMEKLAIVEERMERTPDNLSILARIYGYAAYACPQNKREYLCIAREILQKLSVENPQISDYRERLASIENQLKELK